MKRIIGTVVALAAVLGFGTVGNAAYITYNLAGATTYTSVSSSGIFSNPVGGGSFAQINTDANGDLTDGDVALTGGTLYLVATFNLGALGTITPNTATTLAGATGSLSGSSILWSGLVTTATTGTFSCTGAICGALGVAEGPSYDIAIFNAFSASLGNVAVNPSDLGTWNLAADLSAILSSTAHVVSTNAAIPPPSASAFYNYAGVQIVPEPGTLGLLLLGLGALSLRSRKA